MTILFIILGILIVLICVYIVIGNNLMRQKVQIDETWSQIDVQLKRRNDLIPNLVETVKGYTKYENETLTAITHARSSYMQASSRDDKISEANQLTGLLKTLFAVSENYPDLKANANYQQLMQELTVTEDKISYARQIYNGAVGAFNSSLVVFPSSLVANMKHLTKAEFFKTPENERHVPKVKF